MTTAPRNPALDDLVQHKLLPQVLRPHRHPVRVPDLPVPRGPGRAGNSASASRRRPLPRRQPIVAQILWTHKRTTRVAYLYRTDLAKPKRVPTMAQLAAIGKALTARRTCGTCRKTKGYYIPRSLGECLDCAEGLHR